MQWLTPSLLMMNKMNWKKNHFANYLIWNNAKIFRYFMWSPSFFVILQCWQWKQPRCGFSFRHFLQQNSNTNYSHKLKLKSVFFFLFSSFDTTVCRRESLTRFSKELPKRHEVGFNWINKNAAWHFIFSLIRIKFKAAF